MTEHALIDLPHEPLGVICSFICDKPKLISSLLRTNKDWYNNLYQDENSNVWAEIVMSRPSKVEQFLIEKGDRSFRDLVFSIWEGLDGSGPNSLFVFSNGPKEDLSQQEGMHVVFDEEIAKLFRNTDGFTVEMWINFREHTFFPVMCCLTDRDWNNGFGLFEYTNANDEENSNTINMFVQDWYQDPNYFTTSKIPDVNDWNHFAGVFNFLDNTVKIYMNGELQSQKVVLNHNIEISEGMKLVIGYSDYSGDISYHCLGDFNDIRVWNVARTDEEIFNYFHKRIPKLNFMNSSEYQGLVFNFYPTEDESKSTIHNKSPNLEYRAARFSASNTCTCIVPSEVAHEALKLSMNSLSLSDAPQSLLSKMWSAAGNVVKKVKDSLATSTNNN